MQSNFEPPGCSMTSNTGTAYYLAEEPYTRYRNG
jgi:hypothetical protein